MVRRSTSTTKESLGTGERAGDADGPALRLVERGWRRRFSQQFRALCKKNFIVSFRSWRSTLLRVLSPL